MGPWKSPSDVEGRRQQRARRWAARSGCGAKKNLRAMPKLRVEER
jgi:hypothetical protein